MSITNNLVTLLDNFDFSTMNNSSTSASIDAVMNFLKRAEAHLANCVASPPSSPIMPKSDGLTLPSPIATCVDIREDILGDHLLQNLKNELQVMTFTAMSKGRHSPEIALFGDSQYVFNSVTKNLMPAPVVKDSVMSQVLETINSKLGLKYNSILVNKYKTKNVSLGWHKDDEEVIDNSVPISSLSIGATRRFQISDAIVKSRRSQFLENELIENSIITMKSGIHRSHFHKVAEGRSSKQNECGVRYSLTFRRLNSKTQTSAQPHSSPEMSVSAAANSSSPTETSPTHVITQPAHTPACRHDNCVNTLVFGSSLTKDLDSNILSRRGKTFKVFTRGGARVETIINLINDAVDNEEVCTECVQSIFLVCGGNDAENIRSPAGVEKLKASYNKLINVLNSKFPAIRINILSLIPRRCNSYMHLQRIFSINSFLNNLCSGSHNCFFIKMFTKYLVYKNLFYSHNEVYLNEKLFKKDMLHFSHTGTSVLAKTLIAVANNPRH